MSIFALTWVTYAGYYLCRKNFAIAIPIWLAHRSYRDIDLANCIFVYSLLYAVAQLVIGPLVDRFGSRLVVAGGLLLVVGSNVLMSFEQRPAVLVLLCCLNGMGQATGWAGLVRCMANCFPVRGRGVVMAWWSTNYALGGFVATVFATYCATTSGLLPLLGWRRAFLFPSAVLTLVTILFWTRIREQPEEDSSALTPGVESEPSSTVFSGILSLLAEPALWVISVSYFLLEMTRYGFLFWLPLYLTKALHYGPERAGYISSFFELIGFAGAIAAGYLSDRVFGSRRLPVGALMLAGFALVLYLEPWLARGGFLVTAIGISAMGMFCYGPDTLLCGAAAQDVGGHEHAGAATGIIDGLGHLGSIFSPYLVVYVSRSFGWNALFTIFAALCALAAAILCFQWNYKGSDVRSEYAHSVVCTREADVETL